MELRQVDETPVKKEQVVRLQSDQPPVRHKMPQMPVQPPEAPQRHRLEVPTRDAGEMRTHQPTVDALVEPQRASPDAMELDWGKTPTEQRSIPWGWVALVVAIIGGVAVWSLTRGTESTGPAADVHQAAVTRMEEDAEEDRKAAQLIGRMETTVHQFFAASSVEEIAALVRQPERVVPMMVAYYQEHPLPKKRIVRIGAMEPLTIEQRAIFWVATAEMPDGTSESVFLEILPDGQARVDWETFVNLQPMPWDQFATERPPGTTLDFRVYAEPDTFFSHEFADADVWRSYRLTALDNDETLFGYAKIGSLVETELNEIFARNIGRESAAILRLTVPQGIKSRRGVIIEKVVSGRWLYLDPPDE